MKKSSIFKHFLIFLCFFSTASVCAQIQTTSDTGKMDTLFFLNGEVRAVKVVDTIAHLVRFLPEKSKNRPRVQDIEKSKIFSVKFSNGQERILYFHDSTVGNFFTVLEAKMFVLGEQEAERNYKNKWPALIGFMVGVVSPVVLSNAVLLSPIPASVIPLHTFIPVVEVNTGKIQNKQLLLYDTYLMGYEKVARKKNFMHALIGAGVGLAVGFGTWAIPDKTWNTIGVNTAPVIGDNKLKAFVRKNSIYAVWAGEVGCAIGISMLTNKKHKKAEK